MRIDVRNMDCPKPYLHAKEAINKMSSGTLEVITSDEIECLNLEKLAKLKDLTYNYEKFNDTDYIFYFYIK